MEVVTNKWNGQLYMIVSFDKDKVVLQRMNGSQFTISKSEFNFNYRRNYE